MSTSKLLRSSTILERILDFGILIYVILIPIILLTGGFKISILGIPIRVTHLSSPIKILIPPILADSY